MVVGVSWCPGEIFRPSALYALACDNGDFFPPRGPKADLDF